MFGALLCGACGLVALSTNDAAHTKQFDEVELESNIRFLETNIMILETKIMILENSATRRESTATKAQLRILREELQEATQRRKK